MANITTVANFIGNVNIPDKDLISDNLTWHIQEYEPILLNILLGNDLYAAYIATPADARFTALIGTVGPPSTGYLAKALVNYIFYQYFQTVSTQVTSLGASQNKKKNAITVSMWPEMVKAWNRMVEKNRELHKYLVDNPTIYPEYKNTFPEWFFGWGFWGGIWRCWFFDWYDWSGEYGNCVNEVYRVQNRLGM